VQPSADCLQFITIGIYAAAFMRRHLCGGIYAAVIQLKYGRR
jgi:hypothetical protein